MLGSHTYFLYLPRHTWLVSLTSSQNRSSSSNICNECPHPHFLLTRAAFPSNIHSRTTHSFSIPQKSQTRMISIPFRQTLVGKHLHSHGSSALHNITLRNQGKNELKNLQLPCLLPPKHTFPSRQSL